MLCVWIKKKMGELKKLFLSVNLYLFNCIGIGFFSFKLIDIFFLDGYVYVE